MGCAPSSSRPAKAPKEPVPDVTAVENAVAPTSAHEPSLTVEPFDHLLRRPEATVLNIKQTGTGGSGNTYEIALTPDATGDDLRAYELGPAKPMGGRIVRRQMDDLLALCKRSGLEPIADLAKPENHPVCFTVKDASKGVNEFHILRATPLRDGQVASRFKGLAPYEDLYDFATVEFNWHSHIVNIRLRGEKGETPMYTMRQCSKTVWVLKKKEVVIAMFTQQSGLHPKFVSWEVTIAPNVDQAFVIALTGILDAFRPILLKMRMDFLGA